MSPVLGAEVATEERGVMSSASIVGRGGGGGGGGGALAEILEVPPAWICFKASRASMPSLFQVRPVAKCCLIYAINALKIR